MLRIIDYKFPKTGIVLEQPGNGVWAIVKWNNGLTETIRYTQKNSKFKYKNRYELIEK